MGVTDRDVRELAERGAGSVGEVMRCTGAGTKCGSCRASIAALLHTSSSPGASSEASSLELLQLASSAG
jgi:bacterioferritin-associated ferredoxin